MPVTIGHAPAPVDPFHTLAQQVERIILKGPGSKQARVRDVAKVLKELAKQNFDDGVKSVVDDFTKSAENATKPVTPA